MPVADINTWYRQLIDFVAKNRTSRLIYMHPVGAIQYPKTLNVIFNKADNVKANGLFNWYTMDTLAQFGQRRQQVTWSATDTGNAWSFQASHPSDLTDMAWVLPRTAYTQPVVTQGLGLVTWDTNNWIVTSLGGTSLGFTSGKK
ncbi:hypothetical protein D3C72_1847470 [compost metagenome]